MIHQHFCLAGDCPWCIDILYDVRPQHTETILRQLYDMGCPMRQMSHAEDLLYSGIPNQGLTYSDKCSRRSLIVIGFTDSIGEFFSSLAHEVEHCHDHISQYYGLRPYGEADAYLIGDIAKMIYEDAAGRIKDVFGY